MKVGIDARFIGAQGTGLGKYTEKLIQNLQKIDQTNQYCIFLKEENWDYQKLSKNFKKVLADVNWYTLKEQIKLPAIYKKENLDVLHVPHFNVPVFYRGKFVVTIHDLIHHQFSETTATTRNPLIFKGKRLAYRQVIGHAISKSKKIITPSKYIRSQIIEQYKVPENKIAVTYEAAEEEYFAPSRHPELIGPKPRIAGQGPHGTVYSGSVLKKYQIKKPFLIYVGNAYPHKNLDNLLTAFSFIAFDFAKQNLSTLSLIIVCARDIFAKRLEEKIKSLGLQNRVILTGYIGANELPLIFKSAEAYVFPTLSEGFGIPGLNALASQLPLVCSNIPVLKEIYGQTATYYNPQDPADIAKKIKGVLSDSKTRTDLVKKGNEQVKKYSWSKMAKQTLDIYEASAKL